MLRIAAGLSSFSGLIHATDTFIGTCNGNLGANNLYIIDCMFLLDANHNGVVWRLDAQAFLKKLLLS